MSKRVIAAMVVVLCAVVAQAGTRADLSGDAVVDFATTMDMPLVTVGDPGNAPDMRYNTNQRPEGFGTVDYVYDIGKFEVTAGQYAEFLNAVAATDAYDLYSTAMATHEMGSRIQRAGNAGSYSYTVAADWADRPVNFISWGDAARFCNWLTNGMPTGAQDLTTTEDGSYLLDGETDETVLINVTRRPAAPGRQYFMPTEDEWYKAAYYDGPSDVYYDYPTGSNDVPSNDLIDPDPGNNACSKDVSVTTLGSPYFRTEVGEFENSDSPYGTYDQGGNIDELLELTTYRGYHLTRGGSWNDDTALHALFRPVVMSPGTGVGTPVRGFRVVQIPEPATLSLLALGGLALLKRRERT